MLFLEDQFSSGNQWTPNPKEIDWKKHSLNPEKQLGLLCSCCGKAKYEEAFLWKLESAIIQAPEDFRIIRGYRCQSSIEALAGHPEATECAGCSAHAAGVAVDLAINDDEHRVRVLRALFEVGFKRIGIGVDFIHVDGDLRKKQSVAWLCCTDRKHARDRIGIRDSSIRFKILESHVLSLGAKSLSIGPDFLRTDKGNLVPVSPDPQELIWLRKYQERQAEAERHAKEQESGLAYELMNERLASALLRGIYRDKLSKEEVLATFARENNLSQEDVEEIAAAVSV